MVAVLSTISETITPTSNFWLDCRRIHYRMKRLRYLLVGILAAGLCAQAVLVQASTKGRVHQSQSKKTSIVEQKKNPQKSTSHASKGKSASASPAARKTCRTQRVKQHGRTKVLKVCEAADPVLKSPIKEQDLEKPANDNKDSELKARSAPERAYAVDGETFFFQGRKYRVSGLAGGDGSEMAKQRLQKAIDTGAIAIEPLSVDDSGVATAIVRVNGKNVADQILKP